MAIPSILKQSLIWKIMLIFWLTTIASIVTNIYITQEIMLNENKIKELRSTMKVLAQEAVNVVEQRGPRQLHRWYKKVAKKQGIRVVLLDTKDRPIGLKKQRDPNFDHHTDIPSMADFDHFESGRFEMRLLKAADQNIVSNSGRSYTLRLLPSDYLKTLFGGPGRMQLYRLGSTFLFIFIGSLWLAWSVAKPVNFLRKASEKIAQGDFRIDVSSQVGTRKDELGKLANTFDNMAVQIDSLMSQQRRLFGDISHEIRTPLTRQKLAIELARNADDPSEFLDKLEQQNEVIETLVDDLLTLIRLEENESQTQVERINLRDELKDLVNNAELELNKKHIQIIEGNMQDCTTLAEPAQVSRAIENILTNAIKYSPEYGKIHVNCHTKGNMAEVSIVDEGPGIPEKDLDKVLDPFYRADKSRNKNTGGFGLGLSIVAKIMDKQGGRIRLANQSSSQSASGLKVTLCFPSELKSDIN